MDTTKMRVLSDKIRAIWGKAGELQMSNPELWDDLLLMRIDLDTCKSMIDDEIASAYMAICPHEFVALNSIDEVQCTECGSTEGDVVGRP